MRHRDGGRPPSILGGHGNQPTDRRRDGENPAAAGPRPQAQGAARSGRRRGGRGERRDSGIWAAATAAIRKTTRLRPNRSRECLSATPVRGFRVAPTSPEKAGLVLVAVVLPAAGAAAGANCGAAASLAAPRSTGATAAGGRTPAPTDATAGWALPCEAVAVAFVGALVVAVVTSACPVVGGAVVAGALVVGAAVLGGVVGGQSTGSSVQTPAARHRAGGGDTQPDQRCGRDRARGHGGQKQSGPPKHRHRRRDATLRT